MVSTSWEEHMVEEDAYFMATRKQERTGEREKESQGLGAQDPFQGNSPNDLTSFL
jgi:hypothetical protein